ncbi:MAG TPA: class I SAM-dependent methyltransferase [Candidatus Angelobacter sp.]
MKRIGTSVYDATAATFERYRSLPNAVVESIRSAIWAEAHLPDQARVLDLGAGTGRIGKAFLAAGDFYVGVDSSLGMLQEFSAKPEFRESKISLLAQAEGSQLPFKNAVFDLVLLMQVLNSANWRPIPDECLRVLRPGGIVAVGHTKSPESGVDAQLKHQLAAILETMHVPWHQPREWRRQALAWLEVASVRHWHREAARWKVTTSAEEFLSRHQTGAKFAALPPAVQQESLARLRAWAEINFDSAHAGFEEHHSFDLGIFEF